MQYDKSKYLEYINNSKEWKLKKAEVFSFKGRKCERCGSSRKIHVHHGTYARLFNEEMIDLFVLCNTCHSEYHKKTNAITIQSTVAFIKNQFLHKIVIIKSKPKNKKVHLPKKFKKQTKREKRKNKVKLNGYFNAISAQRMETAQALKRMFYQGNINREEYFEKLKQL